MPFQPGSTWWAVLCCLVLTVPVWAQDHPAVRDILVPDARQRLVTVDTTLQPATLQRGLERMDVRTGYVRARYRIEGARYRRDTPEATARRFLDEHGARFGVADPRAALDVSEVRETGYSSHVRFRQLYAGVPVHGRSLQVNLNRAGEPVSVLSGIAHDLPGAQQFVTTPAVSSAEARTLTGGIVSVSGTISEPVLVVYAAPEPRLAWHLTLWPREVVSELDVLLDARTGEVIRVLEMRTHARAESGLTAMHAHGEATFKLSAFSPPVLTGADRTEINLTATTTVDGLGWVYDPDPLSSAGVPYGGAYVDDFDATTPELNAELREAVLREITRGTDGLHRLVGPHVRIVGGSQTGWAAYTPPALTDPDAFRFSRDQLHFEAVNAYFHIDGSQRYVRNLDMGTGIRDDGVDVHPRGTHEDNSFYLPSRNLILFGTGGVDDAEDASVIWHEYGHALLEATAPGLLTTNAGRAFHEGWSDYWAASHMRYMAENGTVRRTDWRRLFKWDSGDGAIWNANGRILNHPGLYPDAFQCLATTGSCNIYHDGRIWATSLMEIYDVVGREVSDRLNLHSHHYLNSPVSFVDAAENILQADLDLYGGAHRTLLVEVLAARGFIDAADYLLEIEHTPIANTEIVAESIPIQAVVRGLDGVERVRVHYRFEDGTEGVLELEPREYDLFEGLLPLPSTPGVVRYYIEGIDTANRSSVLPAGAPTEMFAFFAGPDTEPPVISHDSPSRASVADWPLRIVAEVTDNFGVDTVWVAFEIDGVTAGEVGMERGEADLFRARLPVLRSQVSGGMTVRYRVVARDVASTPNEAVSPASSWHELQIVDDGILFSADFSGIDPVFTGVEGSWERDVPTYGVLHSRSGGRLWAVVPDGPNPDSVSVSRAQLPEFNLEGLSAAYMVLWHWFDAEHDGTAVPVRNTGASLFDGGNIKLSTDGGTTWDVAVPKGGYNGTVAGAYGNPLAGEPAFGGYSYGWRRDIVPLPAAESVIVRFDFGTDASNSEAARYFAGWYIDQVEVTTHLPEDAVAPVALILPEPAITLAAGTLPPMISIEAVDDTGISEALATYTRSGRDIEVTDTVRLAMRADDPTRFEGFFPAVPALQSGEVLRYRIELADFDGNRAVYPASAEPAFEIRYELHTASNITRLARATGGWKTHAAGWRIDSGSEHRPALVFDPVDLPLNTTEASLNLAHAHAFGPSRGGNVKVSANGGMSWQILQPVGGYGTVLSKDGHEMDGEPVFAGNAQRETVFDLGSFAGKQIRFRIDLAGGAPFEAGERWIVDDVRLVYRTGDAELEQVYAFGLHANFPNPFSQQTRVSFTLHEAGPVLLDLYDLLGRRVMALVDESRSAGTYTLDIDGGALSAGMYVLRLRAGGRVESRRLTVVR
jgi:zinc metalloprotease ZmpB